MEYRLEAIELQGIKTFANITRLEFPGRITAIVGPNGSGKSNIADAIRWVLGEQSFSLLRAKKTEDMIFSGSQQRSRSGMASTTITFNNQDGWLPIDFAHVAITRQAYRDSQNEYLLNGQKVRLKDIHELLSQTGLAERNYSIIGQGLVDAALSLKPDERGKLFEEAAGIGLYRARKEESLRRLESTRKNLDRVLDILAEIKPRLRSLEKQSERYKEYEQLQTDLKNLLREWYGYQWRQKQQDLQTARIAFQNGETQLYSLRKKHKETQKIVDENRARIQANRKILEDTHAEQSELFGKLEHQTRELAIVDERQQSNQRQSENLQIDIANLEEEIQELLLHEHEILTDINQHQAEFTTAEGEFRKNMQQLSEITKERDHAEKILSDTKQARIDLETKLILITARIEELKYRVDSQNAERAKIESAVGIFEVEKLQAEQNLQALEATYQETIKDWDILQEESKTNNLLLKEAQNKRNEVLNHINQLETLRTKTQTQITLLQEAEIALSGYSEGSKTLMGNSRNGKLPKGIEPLSRHIFIEERYERAISAALGELTDLLILPLKSKDILIDYLESNESNRVALVDLEPNKMPEVDLAIHSIDGVFGFANDFIKAAEPYRALIDGLFSDILIVNDAKTAASIQNKFKVDFKIVTLSGLVFYPSGLLISGQSPTGKKIGRTRQQSQLREDLKKQEIAIKRLSENEFEYSEKIKAIGLKLADLEELVKKLDEEKNKIITDTQTVKDSLTRNIEQLSWHQDRLHDLKITINDALRLIKIEEDELKNVESKIQSTKEVETQLINDLDNISLFEVQQSANHWQSQSVIAQNALIMVQQREQDHRNRKKVASDRLSAFQFRYRELEAFQKETLQQKDLLKINIENIQKEISALNQTKIDPLSTTNFELEKQIENLQIEETSSHQKLTIAERKFTQLQLELSRRQDQLDHLIERIQDDFGTVSYETEQNYGSQTPLPFDEKFIEQLPFFEELPASHADEIKRLKIQIRQLGAVNPEALQEYNEVNERYEFLTNQVVDLENASDDLQEVIATLDEMMKNDFLKTYKAVNHEFSSFFSRLFNGGEARLVFSDEANPVEGGIDIEARLPGRRQQGLASLSGGERSLTAVALIFSLLTVSPPPFCILDEVDAMLDESNVGRFIEALRDLSKIMQVVIITHNRNTVQAANVIYGVTMGRDSTSQMISLKLEDVGETYFE